MPFPAIMLVRSTSTVALRTASPCAVTCGPSMLGRVFQVMFSAQLVLLMRLKIPLLTESFVTYRRSLAALTVAPVGSPLTSKRRNDCLTLLPPTAEKLLDVA